MINLSIMPLNENRIDEMCDDIIQQQKDNVSNCAMLMMKFNAECTPPVNKAEKQCRIYDKYRQQLDKYGAKYGVLVQATLGHITKPSSPHPFQSVVSLINGEEYESQCCPLDPGFKKYIRKQMKILATHNPDIVMLDDDIGLMYRKSKGCACRYHMAEFNRRAGTDMSREELYAHILGDSDEDKRYTDIYVDVQKDSLVSVVEEMRKGIDEVNPAIQGIVSGIYVTTFCEFSGDIASAFAGKGNPVTIRLNGGPYSKSSSARTFTESPFRAATLIENTKDKVDVFLAETDTCPQNRYSTSASYMHSHFTSIILEGATGAKHWITRTMAYEPFSGKAYRKILSKYSGFYEKISAMVKELQPFGCRIPLTLMQNYEFKPLSQGMNICPWSTCVIERFGLPMYYGNIGTGAVFLDDYSVDGFNDREITEFLSGTLVLSAGAAQKLSDRGFGGYLGVEVGDIGENKPSHERIYGELFPVQYGCKKLEFISDDAEPLSEVIYNSSSDDAQAGFPGVVRTSNSLGGEVIVFSGTPDMPFTYYTAFSMLNETRKKQLINILSQKNHIPLYYPEDAEVYLRAGFLKDGSIMAVLFNLGFDELEDIPLCVSSKVSNVVKINPDGTKSECTFTADKNIVRVNENLKTLMPLVLIIS